MLLIASLQIQDKVFDNLNSNPKSALKSRLPSSAFLWLHKEACDSALCLCLVALFNSSDHQNRNQYIVHCLHGLRKTALQCGAPLNFLKNYFLSVRHMTLLCTFSYQGLPKYKSALSPLFSFVFKQIASIV